jgi:hypothetical protein
MNNQQKDVLLYGSCCRDINTFPQKNLYVYAYVYIYDYAYKEAPNLPSAEHSNKH